MRFHHSDMQNKVSVTLVPWETDEKSNGIGKGQRLLLFQSLSHSHFFTSSEPHSDVQPHTHSSVHSLSHSVTHYLIQLLATLFNCRPWNTFTSPSFIHFTLYHTPPLLHSLYHSLIQKHIQCHFFIQPLLEPFHQPHHSFIHSHITRFAAPSLSSLSSCVFTLPYSPPSSNDHFRIASVFPSMT